MIRYALGCDKGHEFESWFPSATSFDVQAERGLVACPVCGSPKVEKGIMAPAIGKGGRAAPELSASSVEVAPSAPAPETAAPQPVAFLSEREQAMRAMMRAVREHVTKSADYVGPGFAEQARKMHYGETPHRSIYGEANLLEAKALHEEGIEFHPLPVGPDDRN